MTYAKSKGLTQLSMTQFFGDLVLPKTIFQRKEKTEVSHSVFMKSELPRITNYLWEHPTIWNLGLLLQFETGLRIGELSALKLSDIRGNRLTVKRTEIKVRGDDGKWKCIVQELPKTENGERCIILSDSAVRTLAQIVKLNPHGEYLFENKGVRIRENTFNKRLADVCRDLRITPRSTHKVRRTYSTELLQNGVSEALVASQMGHGDIATTKKFYYFENGVESDKENQINDAIKF